MLFLDCSLPTIEENLALDELLLDIHTWQPDQDVLRLWEAPQTCVILGRASRHAEEARLENCRRDDVPIARRLSGGCTVMGGPGCLMYSLALHRQSPDLPSSPDALHQFVLNRMVNAFLPHCPSMRIRGISDLALGEEKISGNSMRITRETVLYHGTILYAFMLDSMMRYLGTPPREPVYRVARTHQQFVTNLELPRDRLRQCLLEAWPCAGSLQAWPGHRVAPLVEQRYGLESWTFRH